MEERKSPVLSLVLNGGKDETENATVPVKWVFDERFFEAEKPTHLLFVEQSAKEISHYNSANNGRRYLVAIDRLVEHFEIFSSGKHRLRVFAFRATSKDDFDLIKRWLGLNGKTYDKAIYNEEPVYSSIASCSVEFVVPKELFARKPTSVIGKAWWKYLHWPLKRESVDECKTRAKVLWGIPKLFIYLPWLALKFFLFILFSVYLLVAPFFPFFFGYCPQGVKQILSTWKAVWKSHKALSMDVLYQRPYNEVKYKEWYRKDKRGNEGKTMLLMAPWEIVLFGPFILSIIFFSGSLFSSLNSALWFFGTSLLFLVALVIWAVRAGNINKMGGVFDFSFLALSIFLTIFAIIVHINLHPLFSKKAGYDLFWFFSGVLWLVALVLLIIAIVAVVEYLQKRFKKVSNFFRIIFVSPFLFLYRMTVARIISWMLKAAAAYKQRPAVQARRERLRQEALKMAEERRRKDEERKKEDEKRRLEKQQKRQEYLKEVTRKVEKVDLKELPAPQNTGDTIKRFRVNFWALKAKVCRPYDQEN